MKQNILRMIAFAILIIFVGGTVIGCQSFKDYLTNNKETLKEVVKSLIGQIVDEIFKELIDNQKIKTTLDRSINRSITPGNIQSNIVYTPEDIIQLKAKLTERIKAAIDKKEILIDDNIN